MPQDKVPCSPDPLEVGFREELLRIWPEGVPYRVLVAVSGGADSTALARLCDSLRVPSFPQRRESSDTAGLGEVETGIPSCSGLMEAMVIAHFHHHLRPQEADEDEAFVRNLAERLEVPYRRGDWTRQERRELAHEDRNLQAAARRARYEFLFAVAKDLDLPVLLTAHHRDDQAETVMFNLSRGGGTGAWRGIQPAIRRQGIWILRPLLTFTKGDLLNYLDRLGESHREDSSNQSRKYSRNRIRHDLLPEAVTKAPDFLETLLSHSAAARSEEAHWLGLLEPIKKEGLLREDTWTFPLRRFEEMPEEGCFYCLRQLLWEISGAADGWYPIRRQSLLKLFDLLKSGREGGVTFPGGIRVRLRGRALILQKET